MYYVVGGVYAFYKLVTDKEPGITTNIIIFHDIRRWTSSIEYF